MEISSNEKGAVDGSLTKLKMSSYRIGMNLRVTEDSNQGGRRYMEDKHSIRFVKNDEGGFEFAYFGIFDGHGGGEASKYARDHLLNEITKYDCFWSDNDDDVLYAIKSAFLDTHYGMWKEVGRFTTRFYRLFCPGLFFLLNFVVDDRRPFIASNLLVDM